MKLPDTAERQSKFAEFARQLDHAADTNPPEQSWLPWPDQTELTPGSRNTYRWRINTGELLGDGYEAAIRNGYLYARRRP